LDGTWLISQLPLKWFSGASGKKHP
jgi:hypothetical protein